MLLREVNINQRNKMPNTEKPTTIVQQKKSGVVKTEHHGRTPRRRENLLKQAPKDFKEKSLQGAKKQPVPKVPVDKSKVVEKEKKEVKTEEKKKPIQTKPKVKRDFAVVNAKSLPISTKHSIAICRFIKGKKIEKAINDLEPVLILKKAVPMKGEIPHRKGKMMSGRFPKKAVEHFIKLLKSLEANASVNELDEPVIVEAIANLAQRPDGRFGKTKKKRTHVRIKCVEKKEKKK
ncbi:MAG: hypothetical protein KKF39_01110 [Nanoarchaeota archaeon]|nr:hypothetical protein [Nanoarchaeota archaeon]